jgi:two-component system, response regulator
MAKERSAEILLVEDNPDDVELTLHALKGSKLVNRVQVARDGVQALDYLLGVGEFAGRDVLDAPLLILLDLKLPKVNGLEVLRRIRDDPRTAAIPVVILTSSREERDLAESYGLGVNSYVVKPVDFDRFSKVALELGYYWLLINEPPPPKPTAGT